MMLTRVRSLAVIQDLQMCHVGYMRRAINTGVEAHLCPGMCKGRKDKGIFSSLALIVDTTSPTVASESGGDISEPARCMYVHSICKYL
jgi:hypothetical protein